MGNYSIDTNEAKSVASRLEEIRDNLAHIRDEVQSERNKSSISSSSMEVIKKSLDKVINDIDSRSMSIQTLSSALRDIVDIYERAENAVKGSQDAKGSGKSGTTTAGNPIVNFISTLARKIVELFGFASGGDDEDSTYVSDPVNTCTGDYVSAVTEISFSGTPTLSFVRYYNSQYLMEGSMGAGWTHNFEIALAEDEVGRYIDVIWGDKGAERFRETGSGIYIGMRNHFNFIVKGDGYTLRLNEGDTYRFDSQGQILSITAQNGNTLSFEHEEERLRRAYDEAGRSITCDYDEDGRLALVIDSTGREVELHYESDLLTEVVSADGRKKTYTYDADSRLSDITNNAGICVIHNEYDDENRVTKQRFPDGTEMTFTYEGINVIVTDRNGAVTTYRHNERYQITDVIRSDGTQHYTYENNLRTVFTDAAGAAFSRAYDSDGNVVSYTDALNNTVTLSYEGHGLPSVITERNGGTTRRTYDDSGHVTRYEDALGNETLFTYDNNSLVKIVQPDGSSVRFAYDERGNIVARTDEVGNTTTFAYDDAGRLVVRTDPRGMEYSYSYDPCDRLLSVRNPQGQLRTYEYDLAGNVETITDFDGFTETFEYNVLGLRSAVKDKGGRTTSYRYDANGNLAEILLPNGGRVLHEYDGYNRRIATVNELGLRTEYAYDGNGRLVRKSDRRLVTTIEYDPCGRAVRMNETAADGAGRKMTHEKQVVRDAEGRVTQFTRPDGGVIKYTYDLLGRCTERIDPIGAVTAYTYDSRGRLVSIKREGRELRRYSYYPNGNLRTAQNPGGGLVRYEYDAAGNRTKVIYATGYEVSYEYDELNRLSLMSDTSGRRVIYTYDAAGNVSTHTDALGNSSKFAYSPSGQIVRAEDAAGNVASYEYDMMDRLVGITQGEVSAWDAVARGDDGGARRISFERNLRGLITGISDADGNSSSFVYDEYGEMILRTTPESVQTSFEYDAFGMNTGIYFGDGREVQKTYDVMGRLTDMEDWIGRSAIAYDGLGRISSIAGPDGRKTSYEWDVFGGRTAIHYPDGTLVLYDPDDFGRLSQIRTESGAFHYRYDENGRLAIKESPNGVVTYAYNRDGSVRSIVFSDEGGKASEVSYTYDSRGNIHEKKEWTREGGTTNIVYEYDALNQIHKVMENGETIRLYCYDAYGNRVLSEENGTTARFVYNHLNQLIRREVSGNTPERVTTWAYNAEGHAVMEKTETKSAVGSVLESSIRFSYDSASKLSEVATSDGTRHVYEHDGFGNRRSRTTYGHLPEGTDGAGSRSVSGQKTLFYYDYANSHVPLIALHADGAFTDYIRDGELTGLIRDGRLGMYFCDPQGSVRAYRPSEGGDARVYRYDEFGNLEHGIGRYADTEDVQPFGFAGMMWDAASGAYLTRERMYAPTVGRFMMRDEERYIHLRNPRTANLYAYCLNNPIMYVDPDGNDCYYFYLPEWQGEAESDRQRLADQYGYSIDQVHIRPVTNGQELMDGWNAMGTENGQPVDIDTVVINTHADPYNLGFGKDEFGNSRGVLPVSSVSDLQDQSMDQVILYGCNAGHIDYENENMANAFSHKVNDAPVMASDGTVYSNPHGWWKLDYSYEPRNDSKPGPFNDFQDWAGAAGNEGRDNEGWQIYQQVDGRTVRTSTGVKDATIDQMRDLINQNRQKQTSE